jgi:hypothetical protein
MTFSPQCLQLGREGRIVIPRPEALSFAECRMQKHYNAMYIHYLLLYSDYGMFNVTVYAWNLVTEVEAWNDLMVIVTSAPCGPPEVTIPLNSTDGTNPLKYKMSESILVTTLSKVNCSGILSTKKTWEIYSAVVNSTNLYEDLTLVSIADVAPDTSSNAELIIPRRGLTYGVYKLIFLSRMWDDNVEDPMWTRKLPFERNAYTFIEVIPTELVAKMIEGTASFVTRGKGQALQMDPYLYCFDPDFPLLRVIKKI